MTDRSTSTMIMIASKSTPNKDGASTTRQPTNVWTSTPENVAKILQHGYTGPMGTMPNQTANGLSDKDIANLVAFLNSLK